MLSEWFRGDLKYYALLIVDVCIKGECGLRGCVECFLFFVGNGIW